MKDSDPQKKPDAPAEQAEGTTVAAPATEEDHPAVVYRRTEPPKGSKLAATPSSPKPSWVRSLAPTLMPLFIGFLLLLVLISMLGLLSVRRMDEVSLEVMGLEQQHSEKLGLFLKLRLAVTKLNNEARARADSESRRELRPPIDVRLSAARQELNVLLPNLERPTTNDPAWRSFKNDLKAFVEVTEDLRRYSLEGFDKFRIIDRQLDEFLAQSNADQLEVFRQSEAIEQKAVQSIRTWTAFALLVGAFVTIGTIWEVQRRFAEMRRSVDEAKRERVFTGQMLEGMVSAVAAVDQEARIRSANAAFFKIFPGASIGASIYEKIAAEPALRMLEAATQTRVDKSTYRGRWIVPGEDAGDEGRSFDVYSSPLAIDDARGQILTLVDVTEAAEAERGLRRQESLAAVGQATAQVAHEIRNPLGSIRLGVSMLRDNVTDAEGLNTIDLVERGIKHLSKLVVDVAQFSRRKELERANVHLREVINRSLELVSDKIKENDIKVDVKLEDPALTGHWDPDQLRQIVVNLVANAIDASQKGAPITISAETILVEAGDHLAVKKNARITITDQGKGMEKAVLDRVFEPFFSTRKRGTGLGLAIVKQIVEQHGGVIHAESEPGSGTRFIVDLPV
ncbi:MAG TPA: ATP-binding protein [Pyrinomonadaceae bacterium]|nr:ATP-binding protein [Pyrinomonadaceae bacterium]